VEAPDVLIFDAECPYCTVAASTLRTIDDLELIGWDDPAAQQFLREQFGRVPFAMALVEPAAGQVHVGRAAAARLARRAGSPALVGTLVRTQYDRIADVVGRLSGRTRPVDTLGGQHELSADAQRTLTALIAAAGPESAPAQ
jgi:predicted DCC family thiol-disulfide oxidoreductase YuxK